MTIPFVVKGKVKLTAQTLNEIARVINGVPTISSGKPTGGGSSGSPVVVDNTPDIFKIKNGGRNSNNQAIANVSGGNIVTGLTVVSCNDFVLTFPTNSTRYVILTLSYSSGAYSASITVSQTASYPTSTSAAYSITLGKVVTSGNDITTIEQWHYPNDIIVVGRWS